MGISGSMYPPGYYIHVYYRFDDKHVLLCTVDVYIIKYCIYGCLFIMELLTSYPYSDKVLLLAMKDMNVAKLTAADLPLFNGITSDLFPGVDVPVLDYGVVCRQIWGIHTFIVHLSIH